MSRSIKKGPLVNKNLDKKVLKLISSGLRKPIVVYNKALTIMPHYENMLFRVHKGKGFVDLLIRPELIGYRIGDFVKTRFFGGHKEQKTNKTKEKKK